MKFLNNIDMVKNQIKNMLLDIIAGDAGTPAEGQIWYNSSTRKPRIRNNTTNLTIWTDGADVPAANIPNTALTTNPLARANHTGTQLANTVSDFDTQVRTSSLNQLVAPTADLSINTKKLINVVDPTAAQDAATKNYVDGLVQGFSWKKSVRAASTANVTIASALINGLAMDGVTLATGDDVLLKNQTAQAENGIWTVVASGAASRRNDADTAAEVLQMAVYVQAGTLAGDTQWVNTTNAPITLGTTALVFAQAGGGTGVTAGNGLTGTTVLSVVADTGILVSGTGVAVNPAVVVKKYAIDIGTGALTTIVVNHALNTKDITWSVREITGDAFVQVDGVATDVNNLTLTFAVAPTSASLRCIVHG